MRAWLQLAVASVIITVLHAAAAQADLTHRYAFNDGTARDSMGNADGTLFGNASVEDGQLILPGAGNGIAGDHLRLLSDGPGGINIAGYTNATFELWATVNDPAVWSRYFDFGGKSLSNPGAGGNYIFLTPDAGNPPPSITLRATISNVNINTQSGNLNEQEANVSQSTVPLTGANGLTGFERHIALTFNGGANEMRVYYEGDEVGQFLSATHMLANLQEDFALLGASLYNNDPSFNGTINEFRIYNHALSPSAVMNSFLAGPVPEPASGSLLIFGAMLFLLRRTK